MGHLKEGIHMCTNHVSIPHPHSHRGCHIDLQLAVARADGEATEISCLGDIKSFWNKTMPMQGQKNSHYSFKCR